MKKKKIILLAGLPKAGKSLLAGGLYYALQQRGDEFFLERLSPDGEGVWTWDSGNLELARSIKNRLKKAGEFFSPAFIQFKCQSLKTLAKAFRILVGDLGGVPSPENETLVRAAIEAATQAHGKVIPLVLHRKGQDPSSWIQFFAGLGLNPIPVETDWDEEGDLRAQAMSLAWKVLDLLER